MIAMGHIVVERRNQVQTDSTCQGYVCFFNQCCVLTSVGLDIAWLL